MHIKGHAYIARDWVGRCCNQQSFSFAVGNIIASVYDISSIRILERRQR